MNILYISDLDGTLLNEQMRLSEETIRTVNAWIGAGGSFSVATARAWDSAGRVLERLDLRLPVVLMNGVFVYDPVKREYLVSNLLDNETARDVIEGEERLGLRPFVYTVNERQQFKIYYKGIFNASEREYVTNRLKTGDERFRLVEKLDIPPDERVMEINVMGTEQELAATRELFGARLDLTCHFGPDIYAPGYCWLEINHARATKRDGVAQLKRLLQPDRIVCFGDNLNDLPMFEIADEKYAMGNAHPLLKEKATGVLATNAEHGVARYLQTIIPPAPRDKSCGTA
ncbi:HAD-IIB family hydrolase [Paenibacillus ginsengarvi]|uniref:HAD-IIB family hydrolase n=1 Tax=Paenibacillus ginsengarvi TaxID=400777 RepID=A0A3B0CJC1_9BACL|nr:HAD-IIB family hydrolase [Paenibacillus ginsengarvi]RKN85503.1 HAD-IIB family hydrolase [Paenibacillus ginsengarvi]